MREIERVCEEEEFDRRERKRAWVEIERAAAIRACGRKDT